MTILAKSSKKYREDSASSFHRRHPLYKANPNGERGGKTNPQAFFIDFNRPGRATPLAHLVFRENPLRAPSKGPNSTRQYSA